jgi:hypothetical protein
MPRFPKLCLLATFLVAVALQPACQNRKVKVEIAASGDTATRTFATNDTDRRALEAARAAYGTEGAADEELGTRFTGTFAEDALPSEMGNRGAIGRLDSALGSVRGYYEQFADRRGEWDSFAQRVESGRLWMRLFGRFIELKQIKDDAKRAEFRTWWADEMTPLVLDTYLMYSGMQAVVQAQRIGATPRKPDDFTPRTEDEWFRLQVFEPIAILMAERGIFTPDELAVIQIVAMDGNFSGRERGWVSDKVFTPALSRVVARFDPERKDMKLKDFVPIAINFVLWTKLSREYRDIVLESAAIPEDTKSAIRAGKWDFELPPPFGFRTMERPKVTDAEVLLDTGAKPFFTNGVWNPEAKRVDFKGGFYEGKYRYAPYNSPYFAFWALPAQKQESVFGAVILEGEPLADYCIWEAALDDAVRPRWLKALDDLAATKDASGAFAILEETAGSHPMPRVLAAWLAVKTGKPLPAVGPFATMKIDGVTPAPTPSASAAGDA